jgi:hypothetical protein
MPQTVLNFSLLIYPFRHNLIEDRDRRHLQQLTNRWKPWWSRLVDGKDSELLRRALDDTYFFMPYICKLLFPETACIRDAGDSQEIEQEVEKARQLAGLDIEQLAEKLSSHGMLRLTYDPLKLATLNGLQLNFGKDFCAPVSLRWVDVALFPQHVGFLILKAQLNEPHPTTEKLNDLLYHLRFVHPPKIGWRLAHWNLAIAGRTVTFSNQELIEFLLQGFADGSTDHAPTLDAYLSRQPKDHTMRRFSTTEEGQVFGQTLREYTYACIDASSPTPPEAQHSQARDEERQSSITSSRSKEPIFDSPAQQVAYELVTCTQISEPDYKPQPDAVKQLMEKGRIALWTNWEGIALHDNVVFLGIVATPFTRAGLAENVENDYFYLYLLALYQKMRLSIFSGELMRHSEDLYRNLKEARSMVDSFVKFRNHYWFANVSFKPQGTTVYQQFQRGLDVKSLYESVSKEVSELQEYYEKRAERRRETLLFFLTFVGLPAGLLSQIFGGILFQAGTVQLNLRALAILGAASLGAYALSGLLYFLWKRYGR